MNKKTIFWFRQDLRLSDNPGLTHACLDSDVLPLYILDDINPKAHKVGLASRQWLHHSLIALNQSLNGQLQLACGDPLDILIKLCKTHHITEIFWNRNYEPWQIERDTKIKETLLEKGIEVQSFNASLLWEPWEVKKADGTPFKVFTPFYRKGCLNAASPRSPLPIPKIQVIRASSQLNIEDLNLNHSQSADHTQWIIGEQGAQKRLGEFLQHGIEQYKKGRDFPAMQHVSMLSPHLHFGEISPHQIWDAVSHLEEDHNVDHFKSELGWREFSYNLLYYNPTLPTENLQKKFDRFPWVDNPDFLKAWQLGHTGVPMVDAGMRQLLTTGYMHNRVRMIVGSYLVKNLLLDWRHGEKWFWGHLYDADLANNSASWQWVAGCGADAAPYFRIFNPVTQGQRFDPDGEYIKTYLPELKSLPAKYIHCPWDAPSTELQAANITLGTDYPHPIIDLKASREKALNAFASLKQL
ncbi:DNA photolyase family protein [Gammaproteobacteria bacterium]|nr:DNA photolyase family protein [Gammaproteobacteria bacterium]